MKKHRCLPALLYSSLGLLVLLLSAGCSALSGANLPTPYPSEYLPTVLAMTVEAGRQEKTASAKLTALLPSPTTTPTGIPPNPSQNPAPPRVEATSTRTPRTPLPTPTATRLPSRTPTITQTPGIPPAQIQLSSPGAMSKVVSPLEVRAYYHNEPGGYMLIELIAEPLQAGQTGRLLLSKLQRFASGEAYWAGYTQELEFEIRRVSEFSVLRFSVFDSFERPSAVNSVDLLLLQVGESEVNPAGSLLEPITIHEPTKNKLIQGSSLTVSGMTRPEGDQILHFELVTQDKRVVGTRDLFTVPTEDGKHIPFTTEIDYSVSEATWVRLIAYYLDTRISGYRQLASVPILLSP